LKSNKTQKIAIKDGNERVGVAPPNPQFPNALTNQIYSLSGIAKLKEEIRAAAADRDRLVVPEFADGGLLTPGFLSQYGQFKQRYGVLKFIFAVLLKYLHCQYSKLVCLETTNL
jgi:hypothetical protein